MQNSRIIALELILVLWLWWGHGGVSPSSNFAGSGNFTVRYVQLLMQKNVWILFRAYAGERLVHFAPIYHLHSQPQCSTTHHHHQACGIFHGHAYELKKPASAPA